jgi:hypothetical protein
VTNPTVQVSECLPRIWVERGGPSLAALLAALDESWAGATEEWPPRPALDRLAVDRLVSATGWGALLAEVGGSSGVRHPDHLPGLLLATLAGNPGCLADWMTCLFGLELRTYETEAPLGRLSRGTPAVRLTLAGPQPANPVVVVRVVRRLIPAHFSVDATSITWLPEGDSHV